MAAVVRRIMTASKGRALVATKSLPPKQMLFRERALVVSAVGSACSNCLRSSVYHCGSCASKYCSFECKTDAWKTHSLVCGLSFSDSGADKQQRNFPLMAARLLTQHLLEVAAPASKQPNSALLWSRLGTLCHANIAAAAVADDFERFVAFLHNSLEHPSSATPKVFDKLPSIAQLKEILPLEMFARAVGVLHLNTFSVLRPATKPQSATAAFEKVGSALFETASFFNHSCSPNVELATDFEHEDDGLFTFRTLRAVQPDEELCVAYVDPALPDAERKQHLKWAYGFDCDCPRCAGKS